MHFCLGKGSWRALGLLPSGPLGGLRWALLSTDSPEPAALWGCAWGQPSVVRSPPSCHPRWPAHLSSQLSRCLLYGSLQSKPTPVVNRSLKPSLVKKMQQNQKEGEKVKSLSRLRLCDPMDCSPPGPSVCRIFQARVLEWVARTFPGDLPNPGIEPGLLHCGQTLPSEPPGKKGGNTWDL